MSQRWRVIDLIAYDGPVDVRRGRIVADGTEVPLSDVACILTGTDTQWSGSLVAMAAKFEVPLVSCDWRGVPYSVTTPWSSNTRVATRHLAQCDLSLPRKKNAWMQLIRAKISGQASNLPSPHRERLLELAKSVRSGDPENLEARAARMYWARLFGSESFSRDLDGLGRNAHLNYGYAVLRGYVIRAIVTAGLIPGLGVFHRNRSNAFGLADDLIEPFRPAVDFAVMQLPPYASLDDRNVKAHLVAATSMPMGTTGTSVLSAINDLAQRYAMYAEGDIDRLPVPVWVRPDG